MIQDKIYSYFDGNPDLRTLFVFDSMGAIHNDLDGLVWKDEYRLVVFNGDWFSVKYNISHEWKDEKVILIFIGMNAPSVHVEMTAFPLYGEMKANMVYSEENYITFMQLKGINPDFAPYISRHVAEMQLSKYDKILSEYYKPGVFSIDICNRALLSGYIGGTKLLSWEELIIKLVCICGNPDDKDKRDTFFRALKNNLDGTKALSEKMTGIAGHGLDMMTDIKIKKFAESFKYNAITQGIPVITADDYKDYKIDDAITLQRLNSLREQAANHPTLSAQFSRSINKLAEAIKEDSIIKWYGPDAEYSFVTESLSYPIIKNLIEERAFTSPVATNEKLRSMSMRLPVESGLQNAINFLSNACFMLEKIQAIGTYKLKTPMEYIYKYWNEFYLVDTYYRQSVYTFSDIDSILPIFECIASFKKHLDAEYSKQCNLFNQEWIRCVNESGVSLAKMDGILHQQDFYNEKLKGVNAKRVVIISDALRYEVAVEILNSLGDAKHNASLTPALAILPTETKYSKNVLLPHSVLQYNDCGLLVDGENLELIEKRSAHIKKYEPNATCIDFTELNKYTRDQKREIFKSPLVYIFHDTIDSISHDNPTKTARACAEAVAEIKNLIPSLHATYNVANVYVTSDHGFLYNDIQFEEKDKHKITDSYDERKTRYYITDDGNDVLGVSKYQMSAVSTMTNVGKYIAVPDGTNRLNAEGGGYQFAHGGASLQEMIIPVLYSHLRRSDNKEKVGMTLIGSALSIISSRLKFSIIQDQAVSEDYKDRTVVCGIFEGSTLLTAEKEIELSSTDVNPQNRFITVELVLRKPATGGLLELRIFDVEDKLNPIAKATVTNKTLIEQDF